MIITDRFIYIHLPKTGGTFVTEVLHRLHSTPKEIPPTTRLFAGRLTSSFLHRLPAKKSDSTSLKYGPIFDIVPKHGTYMDIPQSHRNKPVLSCVRNPYDWYVSQYEFAWWKTRELAPTETLTPAGYAFTMAIPEFQRMHARFPDLSFAEFIGLCDRAAAVFNEGQAIGLYTQNFVRFYSRDLADVLMPVRDVSSEVAKIALDSNVRFIDMAQLQNDLSEYLASMGYERPDLEFIRGLGKVLPMGKGRTSEQLWEHYYTPELKAHIRERDREIFGLFPNFDSV
jgi:hypothetical protein